MLARFSGILQQFARGPAIFILLLLDTAFMFIIFPMRGALLRADAGGPGPIDMQFFYTPARVYSMVASYGDNGRTFYRNSELTIDIIYPIVYTLLLSLLISRLYQRGFPLDSRIQRLNLVPLGAWLFDLLENLGIVSMLSIYPSTPALLARVTSFFTMVKWLFAGASLALVMAGLGMALWRGFKKHA